MKEIQKRRVAAFSKFGYIVGCLILYLIALAIIVIAVVNILQGWSAGNYSVYKLLDEVGLLVFSIAVIDVVKYLMVEEVIREKEQSCPTAKRKALTKFAVIISTALSLEGLVLTIETAKTDVTQILYPMSLLITAILFIVGIGIYQRLNSSSEKG